VRGGGLGTRRHRHVQQRTAGRDATDDPDPGTAGTGQVDGHPQMVRASGKAGSGTKVHLSPGRSTADGGPARRSRVDREARGGRAPILPRMPDGHVVVIGGAEDKVRERVILNRFVALAGGPDARIAVISTASSLGLQAGEMYRRVFGELGVRDVFPIHATTRAEANDDSNSRLVRDSTGIFMTGGNQLRLSSTIGGTNIARSILERHRQGAVVAGTSAGASAMSTHMVAFGASGGSPRQRMAQMAAGLGVLPGVIVDQHFQQRNRLGRLLAIIAQNPSLLGIGIDEDTAGVVGPEGVLEVIGRRSVTVIDGAAADTDAWEVAAHRPIMISNVVLHSLPAGYRFDLRRRIRLASPVLRALEGGETIAAS
jgi:cyanophycinase